MTMSAGAPCLDIVTKTKSNWTSTGLLYTTLKVRSRAATGTTHTALTPEGESEKRKDARKHELSNVITAVLRRHPILHYFQGYHDIVQVLLLVLGAHAAVPAVSRLSLLRIRDFMLPTMSGTESHLHLLPAVLYAVDPVLCKHVSHTQPFFALAATLTLYAHDIEEYGDIARLFDFLLASEAAVSLYLFAVVRHAYISKEANNSLTMRHRLSCLVVTSCLR